MRKQVFILTILFVFIASAGAVAVSAQTSSPMATAYMNAASSATAPSVNPLQLPMPSSVRADITEPSVNPLQLPLPSSVLTVSATTTKPTTFILLASSQSVKLNAKYKWVGGVLANGGSCLGGQTVQLWWKVGSGAWAIKATGKTSEGFVGWYVTSSKAQTIQYQVRYAGTTVYKPAVSNIVGVKYENTVTKPYLTYMWATSPRPVVTHGTTASFKARLYHGLVGLGGKTVTIWAWNTQTSKWVSLGNTKTLTGGNAGVVTRSIQSAKAGMTTFKVTFAGDSAYAASQSNTVQLIWT